MGTKNDEREGIGRITSGISVRAFALGTISFVRQQLPAWRDDPDRPDEKSEPKLNLQLCKFLDSRARSDFPMVRFDHEEYQTGRGRVDLSASPVTGLYLEATPYSIYDPILVLEGKRLPAPSSDREREYVSGTIPNRPTGGIQRFKLGLHGARLDLSAMIGYLQDKSARHWCGKINEWILELAGKTIADGCVWKAGENLEFVEEDMTERVASYRSAHSRAGDVTSDMITLYHLWIAMN